MLLEQNPMALTDALRSLVPLEEPKREEGESRKRGDGSLSKEEEISGTEGISGGSSGTEALLYRVLNDRHFTVPKAFTIRAEALCTAEIAIYTSGEGRRQAISDVLCGFGADRMAAGGYCLCQGMGGTDGPAAGPGICF